MTYPKLFILHLKDSIDRKKHMEKILSELPMTVEFIEAVDARTFSDEEISQVYQDNICRKTIGRSLTKGEIGCGLSHIKIWKKIRKKNIDSAFIIEDDIIIKDRTAFFEVLKKIEFFPQDWELILFAHGFSHYTGHGDETSLFHKHKIYQHYKIKRFTNKASGTLAYLINQKGIKKLLKEISTQLSGPLDHCYTGNDKIINLYGIEPVIIEESNSLNSIIGMRNTKENQIFISHTFMHQMINQLEKFLKMFYLFGFF